MSQQTYQWDFPLPRTHTGMLQGNGRLGAMIWGEGSTLRITLGRADLWDHRGGMQWTAEMNYARIRELLEAGDERGLRAIFEDVAARPGEPRNPSVVPVGRIDLEFDKPLTLRRGELTPASGHVQVIIAAPDGREHAIELDMSMDEPVLLVELPPGVAAPKVLCVPAWNYVGEQLSRISFSPPQPFDDGASAGWVQTLPADEPVCVAARHDGPRLWIAADRGADAPSARRRADERLAAHAAAGPQAMRSTAQRWWNDFWSRAPRVRVPNATLQMLYDYGMYKLAGLTNPAGVPATLQGPWIEEYQMPPWSSDYHFNINVQMCYWPAWQGNQLHHLRPVLEMVWSWRDRLRQYARLFAGVDDGLLLPHSVDDRGQIIGGFWTGTIDHGCTAWVGRMMYDYWLYGGDERFLRQIAHPFMLGAMRVYEAMLQRRDGRFVLPVSVSPEYRGNALNAWGANASFQLGWIHWLIEALLHAGEVLGVPAQPQWKQIQQDLPRASIYGSGKWQRIGLWDGTDLEESHRHHSHMAGIWPINVIDPDDPQWAATVANTYRHWVSRGMGHWSGWCMPWAAMLHTHVGNADAAELTMDIWQRVFTNEGHGTLHNVAFHGFSTTWWPGNEVMQTDAGMAATAAIMDMLVYVSRGVHHLFRGSPARWKDVAFEGIRTEGGFLISAQRSGGTVQRIEVRADRPATLRLASPWPGKACVASIGGKEMRSDAATIELQLSAGQTAELRPAT